MALTDVAVRKAKAADKDYKLSDSGGLYLFVTKTGFRSWRLKYRFADKERRLVLGPYPEISLAEARDLRDEARRHLREHRDPGIERLKAKAAAEAASSKTFEVTARAWHEIQQPRWSSDYAFLVMRALERDIFPRLGALPIKDVTGQIVLAALRAIEKRGSIETAHRIRQHVSAVFVFAMSEGSVENDPTASLGKGLKKKPPVKKQSAITALDELRELVRAIDGSDRVGSVLKLASRMLALTAVRPGVLRRTPWAEFEGFDWDGSFVGPTRPVWRIPAERMKLDVERKGDAAFEHVVPLSRQAVDVLRAVRRVTGRMPFVFPNGRSSHKPMSENALRAAYIRLGFGERHVPHGWRAAFSTIMNARAERLKRSGDRAVIDLMLAHEPEGKSGSESAYNRASYEERRREIAQEWADLLLAGMPAAGRLVTAD